MKYFHYQATKPMSQVWSLFKDLGMMSESQKELLYNGSDYSHTLDIVKAALNGSISLSEEAVQSFNLTAYEYACRRNEKNGKYNESKDLLHIVDYDGSEDDVRVGYGEVSSRKIKSIDESFDEIMNSQTFEANIRELCGVRKKYIMEQGIDLVSVLIGALKGVPEALKEIKKVIKDSKILDLVVSLCENGSDGRLLRALEAAV